MCNIVYMCVQSIAMQNDAQRNSFGDRINADLILSNGHRHHQRDLFSGSLGIPDVTTHVGSVIHAFESMARTRPGSAGTNAQIESTTAAANVNSSNKNDDDLLLSHAEPPYELATISNTVIGSPTTDQIDKSNNTLGRRQHIFRKSDSGESSKLMSSMHQRNRHRYIDIPTPPPPPNIPPSALPSFSMSHDIDEDELTSESPATKPISNKNSASKSTTMHQYNSNHHTLPHGVHGLVDSMVAVNEITQQFIPASQIIRMNEHQQQAIGDRNAVNGPNPHNSSNNNNNNAIAEPTTKRTVSITRGRTFDDTTTTIQFRQRNGNANISTHEYRRKMFGSHPNIVHDAKVFNQSIANTPKPNRSSLKTNYANINFREHFDQSPNYFVQKSDSNNNVNKGGSGGNSKNIVHNRQLHERSKSDVYFVQSDILGNTFLNTFPNQVNSNLVNNNNTTSSNLIGTDENWLHHNSKIITNNNIGNYINSNHNIGDDDRAFLRGTTVSQSFIKTMKHPQSHHHHNHQLPKVIKTTNSALNGFKRVDEPKSAQLSKSASRRAVSATRNMDTFYTKHRYILSDDDNDYEDELRARYTEHGSGSGSASKKSLPKEFIPSKSTGTGFGYRRQK